MVIVVASYRLPTPPIGVIALVSEPIRMMECAFRYLGWPAAWGRVVAALQTGSIPLLRVVQTGTYCVCCSGAYLQALSKELEPWSRRARGGAEAADTCRDRERVCEGGGTGHSLPKCWRTQHRRGSLQRDTLKICITEAAAAPTPPRVVVSAAGRRAWPIDLRGGAPAGSRAHSTELSRAVGHVEIAAAVQDDS